jgi:hypothetical protein
VAVSRIERWDCELLGVPHTVQRMNSMVASLSRTRSRLIAIADCPIMIVPMWWPTLTGEIFGR